MKKVVVFFLIVCVLCSFFCFYGCKKQYSGEYADLYTVAINSLLWNRGMSTVTDKLCDPDIQILETDTYGRVLFKYTEKSFNQDISFSSLLILQAKNEDSVYYYEDDNFICKEKKSYNNTVDFEAQEIENLKKVNDWNQDVKIDKCIKKEICYFKKELPIDEKKIVEIFSKEYEGYYSNLTFLLTSDDQGRFICYSYILIVKESGVEKKYVVTLFDNDLSYSIFEPLSTYKYQKELQEFKKDNSWGQVNTVDGGLS